ncbi:MAG: hypothetical protein WC791_01415 [Candidatus Paceibacterota bacterium]|jgi:hypothetical protein
MDDIKKKQMNDVLVPHNEVVRRPVVVPESRPSISPERAGDRIENNPFFEKSRSAKVRKPVESSGSGVRGILWALVFVALLACGFVVANYFATAIIEISPTTREATLDADFTAVKELAAHDDSLVFQFVSLTDEKTKEAPVTVEKNIQNKATGKVIIYNNYSTATQKLVINTRLETPDHKIFHIDKSVVVPGYKVVSGKTVPGSIEATIYADAAGEKYNIDKPVDFTIPGFKGDPRYTRFYARSKPDSVLAGGFAGTVKVPSDEAIAQAMEELKQDLKKEATEKARAQIPENVTFFPGSVIVKFEEVPQDYSADNAANVTVRATASVFFFDTDSLIKVLTATAFTDDTTATPYGIPDMSTLTFTFIDPVDNVVLSDISKLQFHIAGPASFVGKIDSAKIIASLVGKNKNDFSAMIADQSNIHKANLTIRPVWKTVFPTDPTKITVKILTK